MPYAVSDYIWFCVVIPLPCCILGLCILLGAERYFRSVIKRVRETHNSSGLGMAKFVFILFCPLGALLMILSATFLLFNSSILFHQNSPVITVEGTVQDISPMPMPLPGPDGWRRSSIFEVDGKLFYVFDAGELMDGDLVSFQCLENTNSVLSFSFTRPVIEPEPELTALYFSYDLYVHTWFWGSIQSLLFLLLIPFVGILVDIIQKKRSAKPVSVRLYGFFTGSGIFVFLLLINLSSLVQGIQILREPDPSGLTSSGIIQAIQEVQDGDKINTEYGTGFGQELLINNKLYFIPTAGDLAVGDYVDFRYLPESQCILECVRQDP